jgi:1-phosphatidylinositol-4-phosphate 5-kinase
VAAAEVVQGKDERPLVGNLIGEDHANYVLMYNMLTGIRIAVRGGSLSMTHNLTRPRSRDARQRSNEN